MVLRAFDRLKAMPNAVRYSVLELRSLGNIRWLIATTGLLIIFPWLLLLTPLVFGQVEYSLDKVVALVAFSSMSFLVILIVCRTSLLDVAKKRPYTIGAAASFALGVITVLVGAHRGTQIDFGVPFDLIICGIGASMASVGYSMWIVRWISAPFARMKREHVALVLPFAAFVGLLLVILALLLSFPFGCFLMVAVYVVVFGVADRLECDDVTQLLSIAGTLSRADVFVMQDGRLVKVTMSICAFAFGYNLVSLMASDMLMQGGQNYLWVMLLLAIVTALCLTVLCLMCQYSLTLLLLMSSVLLASVGSLLTCFSGSRLVGSAVLLAGFFVLTLFYFAFYNAVSHRKDCSRERGIKIFWHTMCIIPLCVVVAVAAYVAISFTVPALLPYMGAGVSVALMMVLMLMYCRELMSTRSALAQKSETTIALSRVKDFASTTGSFYGLTDRECEVIQLFMSGRSAIAAAHELCLAESTVKTHARSIYRKMDVHSRQQMIDLVSREIFS